MTAADWVGTILTVVIFLLMVGVYVYVLRPKKRKELDPNRFIPLDDDRTDSGEQNDR